MVLEPEPGIMVAKNWTPNVVALFSSIFVKIQHGLMILHENISIIAGLCYCKFNMA